VAEDRPPVETSLPAPATGFDSSPAAPSGAPLLPPVLELLGLPALDSEPADEGTASPTT
jgi:hypothetical protein